MDLKEVEHRLIKMAKHGDSEADAIAVVKALDAVARGIGTSWLFEEVRPGCFHVTCPKCGVAYEHYAKKRPCETNTVRTTSTAQCAGRNCLQLMKKA